MNKERAIETLNKHGVQANKFWSNGKLEAAVKELHTAVASERLRNSWITRKQLYGNSGLKDTTFRSDVVERAWKSRKGEKTDA